MASKDFAFYAAPSLPPSGVLSRWRRIKNPAQMVLFSHCLDGYLHGQRTEFDDDCL
nr:hypothetical protein [uncultured Desulfobulbus sp.]